MNKKYKQKSILFLAANPRETTSLRLQEEEREIKDKLRSQGYGKVPIYSSGATRPRDIQQAMLDSKPQIVHFSGHGIGEEGLVFEDMDGQTKLISSEALADLAKIFAERGLECIVLNACYSKYQAEAIVQHIPHVIGMSQAVGDRAAIELSSGFYGAVGSGESIEFAYRLGCNAIALAGLQGHLIPVLFGKQQKQSSLIEESVKRASSMYPSPPPEIPDPISEEKLQVALDNSLLRWQKVVSSLPEDLEKTRIEIFREYKFKTFIDAINFMHQTAPVCDHALHHPRWENTWKTVSVYLTTWDIGQRISDRDIQLAKFFDHAFANFSGSDFEA
jgi:pterin-4a-carbinolamine dehydratase